MPATTFSKSFTPEVVVSAPGRINLIGEHTDYNMGYVLPAAIDKRIQFKFRKNGTATLCRILSEGYEDAVILDLDSLHKSEHSWHNYLIGVLLEMQKRTTRLQGFDCIVHSKLPTGSGLSSSAALECGFAFGLNELFECTLSQIDIVSLSRDAEHNFVGMQCGIMDQFASVMGKEDHVLLLDCKTLEHTYVPIQLGPYKFIFLNSNVSHNLAKSEYNQRRQECEQGLAVIQKKHPGARSLRDISLGQLEACKLGMDRKTYRRCRFVLEENDRVLKVVASLKANDLDTVGKLLYEGHAGLKKLFEVTCQETDFLVEFAHKFGKVLGARQMGGGFGGCTINLLHQDDAAAFIAASAQAYKERFTIDLTPFDAAFATGVIRID